MERPDLESAADLWQRRLNGFASIEHEGQLMDCVPALLAYIRHLESGAPALAKWFADVDEWAEDDSRGPGESFDLLMRVLEILRPEPTPEPIQPPEVPHA